MQVASWDPDLQNALRIAVTIPVWAGMGWHGVLELC